MEKNRSRRAELLQWILAILMVLGGAALLHASKAKPALGNACPTCGCNGGSGGD